MTIIRRLTILVLGSLGLVAVTASSASAGMVLTNHSQPETVGAASARMAG